MQTIVSEGNRRQIFDNVNKTVKDDLVATVSKGDKLSAAVACFSIYACQADALLAGEYIKVFEQVNRMAIVAGISLQTVNIAAAADIAAIYGILVTLKVADCDKKNVLFLSKLIDQRMVFSAEVVGIDLEGGRNLDETIAANERRVKLTQQITALEQKAMNERQSRTKWEYTGEIKKLKQELEELSNG